MSEKEEKEKTGWIGKEEVTSVYVDSISTAYRKNAIKVELGQVISKGEREKTRIKVVGSFIMDPSTFKYTILDALKKQMRMYEESHGELKLEEEK
jgi:hypothetical protein